MIDAPNVLQAIAFGKFSSIDNQDYNKYEDLIESSDPDMVTICRDNEYFIILIDGDNVHLISKEEREDGGYTSLQFYLREL